MPLNLLQTLLQCNFFRKTNAMHWKKFKFWQVVSFSCDFSPSITPWKLQNSSGFLMFWRSTERERGLKSVNLLFYCSRNIVLGLHKHLATSNFTWMCNIFLWATQCQLCLNCEEKASLTRLIEGHLDSSKMVRSLSLSVQRALNRQPSDFKCNHITRPATFPVI